MSEHRGTITNPVSDFSFTVNPMAAASFHDDGIVILHLAKGRLFSSNGTGARIWRGLEQQQPVEAIAKEISSKFKIEPTTAREHTLGFLAELERHTLIQREAAL